MVAEHVAQWHHVRRFRGLEGKKVQRIRKKEGSEDQKEKRFRGSEVQKKVGGSKRRPDGSADSSSYAN